MFIKHKKLLLKLGAFSLDSHTFCTDFCIRMEAIIVRWKLPLIPFIVMPIAYIGVAYSGLASSYGDVLEVAISLVWLPIAIAVFYILATQKKNWLLAEIGAVLHTIFTCFVCQTYYFSLYEFKMSFGFINKSFGYRAGSVVLIFCIFFVLVMFKKCQKDAVQSGL